MAVNIGERYGKWVVVSGGSDSRHRTCRCDCGTVKEVRTDHLIDGRSRSCGCSKKENHPWIYKGRPNRRELNHVYGCMIARCYNPSADSYCRYGGRGISVCDEWRKSFDSFADWAYINGYKKGLTIDRIDNNLGYSPDNCRWATKQEQNHNKRNNVVLMVDGERYTVTQAARKADINPSKVFGWLYNGTSKDEVIQRLKAVKWDE
jgi:hypothetical protein